MESIFLKKQGQSPKNKILDFLITHSDLDYSLKEISRYSGAGYSTVKILVKKLAKDKWINPTRKISKIILCELNTENTEVKKFTEFYWEVIEQEVEGKNKEEGSDRFGCPSPVGSVSVSARNIQFLYGCFSKQPIFKAIRSFLVCYKVQLP
jgi:hypothetical protein